MSRFLPRLHGCFLGWEAHLLLNDVRSYVSPLSFTLHVICVFFRGFVQWLGSPAVFGRFHGRVL